MKIKKIFSNDQKKNMNEDSNVKKAKVANVSIEYNEYTDVIKLSVGDRIFETNSDVWPYINLKVKNLIKSQ